MLCPQDLCIFVMLSVFCITKMHRSWPKIATEGDSIGHRAPPYEILWAIYLRLLFGGFLCPQHIHFLAAYLLSHVNVAEWHSLPAKFIVETAGTTIRLLKAAMALEALQLM